MFKYYLVVAEFRQRGEGIPAIGRHIHPARHPAQLLTQLCQEDAFLEMSRGSALNHPNKFLISMPYWNADWYGGNH